MTCRTGRDDLSDESDGSAGAKSYRTGRRTHLCVSPDWSDLPDWSDRADRSDSSDWSDLSYSSDWSDLSYSSDWSDWSDWSDSSDWSDLSDRSDGLPVLIYVYLVGRAPLCPAVGAQRLSRSLRSSARLSAARLSPLAIASVKHFSASSYLPVRARAIPRLLSVSAVGAFT